MSSASSRPGSRSSPSASEAGRVAIVVAARLAADGYALGVAHFRAVSDDDYARVVIAEAFARAPKLDPSGTSWLPAPFWLTGGAMAVFGRSLEVARLVALALGFAASLLLYYGAKRVVGDPRRAAWAAAIATLTPWSVFLGAATVPELITAALSFFALATLVEHGETDAKARLLGAAALGAATLCRYEAWPLALGFAALTGWDAARVGGQARIRFALAALAAMLGPLGWILWNRHAHGDAFQFAARVAAFSRAASAAGGASIEPLGYLVALVADRPGLTLALLVVFVWALIRRKEVGEDVRRWARPAALVALALALLTVAGIGDAAPTHHPERVTLLATLLATMAATSLSLRLLAKLPDDKAAAARLVVLAVGATAFASGAPFVDRGAEEAVGAAARGEVKAGESVLLQVVDYGYLATVASFGRPEDAVSDRSIDPREGPRPSSFDDPVALAAAVERVKPVAVIARADSAAPAVLGAPAGVFRSWAIFRSVHP